ncbi:hypothetical protein [Polaromonas sp.]|uniref:hypothetical protein n=1 Tax=Polaromonas sp. TaxID=1869339 RepID=UPI003C96EA16
MTALMHTNLIAAVLVLGVCGSAHATSAVSFEAEGYLLDILVGNDSRPAVAGLSFAAPGSVRSTEIPLRHLSIDAFDAGQKILLLRFMNPADPALPKDFVLAVRNDVGVLKIEGKSISGRFSWGM